MTLQQQNWRGLRKVSHYALRRHRLRLCVVAAVITVVSGLLGSVASPSAASIPSVVGSSDTAIHWGFDRGSLDGWTVQSGSQLGTVVSGQNYYFNNPTILYNKEGSYFLTTALQPDGTPTNANTGVINSPLFRLTRPAVTMLVGGGSSPTTYVAACLPDSKQPYGCRVVGKVQGNNAEPMLLRSMDLASYVGKKLFLQVVDENTLPSIFSGKGGPVGYVALDDVRINSIPMPHHVQGARTPAKVVGLSWKPTGVSDLAGYQIYRKTVVPTAGTATSPYSGYSLLTSVPATATSYTDATADRSTGYYYRVVAVSSNGSTSDDQNQIYVSPYRNLFARGSTVAYSGANLSGIEFPVGPLGSGGVVQFGDGTKNEAWIFNQVNQTQPPGGHFESFQPRDQGYVPNSFFAVRAARMAPGAIPVVRALQTTRQGGFGAVKSLTFRGEYPIAQYRFTDPALPVQVSESVTSPTSPGDLKNSAIPAAIYTFTITNSSATPASVSLLASQQNAVGFSGVATIGGVNNDQYYGYGANRNRITGSRLGTNLVMTGQGGSMDMSMYARKVTGTAGWTDMTRLESQFAASGSVAGPTAAHSPKAGTTVDGALTTSVVVPARGQVKIPVSLNWYFPNAAFRGFGGEGEQYANWWTSAADVAHYVAVNFPSLMHSTQRFHDSVYDSNLPHYVLDRITSGVAVLHTPTVFWAKNGFFGGWEGYGCCWGMPTHVWEYAQTASALWPQIGKLWATQWLDAEQPDGLILRLNL